MSIRVQNNIEKYYALELHLSIISGLEAGNYGQIYLHHSNFSSLSQTPRVFFSCRLSIQMENNDALKDALAASLQAKEDDMRLFNDMVEQTKKIFLQGLRQYKQSVNPLGEP